MYILKAFQSLLAAKIIFYDLPVRVLLVAKALSFYIVYHHFSFLVYRTQIRLALDPEMHRFVLLSPSTYRLILSVKNDSTDFFCPLLTKRLNYINIYI